MEEQLRVTNNEQTSSTGLSTGLTPAPPSLQPPCCSSEQPLRTHSLHSRHQLSPPPPPPLLSQDTCTPPTDPSQLLQQTTPSCPGCWKPNWRTSEWILLSSHGSMPIWQIDCSMWDYKTVRLTVWLAICFLTDLILRPLLPLLTLLLNLLLFANFQLLKASAPQLCGVLHHVFSMSLNLQNPCVEEDVLTWPTPEDAASLWLQGLQIRDTDLPHHEDPGETHLGAAIVSSLLFDLGQTPLVSPNLEIPTFSACKKCLFFNRFSSEGYLFCHYFHKKTKKQKTKKPPHFFLLYTWPSKSSLKLYLRWL